MSDRPLYANEMAAALRLAESVIRDPDGLTPHGALTLARALLQADRYTPGEFADAEMRRLQQLALPFEATL